MTKNIAKYLGIKAIFLKNCAIIINKYKKKEKMKNYLFLIKGKIAVQQFILLFFPIFFLSFALLSCDLLVPRVIEFDKERFDQEWVAWEEQGLVDYSVR